MSYVPWTTTAAVRKSMQGNRSRDTKPEKVLRSLLHRRGLRFRVCCPPLATSRLTADVVFTRARVAVFIDGCYWHGCPAHYRQPKTNPDYWSAKIARNQERDQGFDEELDQAGWTVIRVWAHEDPGDIADRVEQKVRRS
jgi:DNA mismatch endonuclease, patch repair protein